MGSAFHQLCPRYNGTLTPTAPTAIRLWDTFTFTFYSQGSKVILKADFPIDSSVFSSYRKLHFGSSVEQIILLLLKS